MKDLIIREKNLNEVMEGINIVYRELGSIITSLVEFQNRVSNVEDNFIRPFEKKMLIDARTSKVISICGNKRSNAYKNKSFRSRVYQDIFRNIKNIYNINKYDAISKCNFEEAMKLINEYVLPLELKYELDKINLHE